MLGADRLISIKTIVDTAGGKDSAGMQCYIGWDAFIFGNLLVLELASVSKRVWLL